MADHRWIVERLDENGNPVDWLFTIFPAAKNVRMGRWTSAKWEALTFAMTVYAEAQLLRLHESSRPGPGRFRVVPATDKEGALR